MAAVFCTGTGLGGSEEVFLLAFERACERLSCLEELSDAPRLFFFDLVRGNFNFGSKGMAIDSSDLRDWLKVAK